MNKTKKILSISIGLAFAATAQVSAGSSPKNSKDFMVDKFIVQFADGFNSKKEKSVYRKKIDNIKRITGSEMSYSRQLVDQFHIVTLKKKVKFEKAKRIARKMFGRDRNVVSVIPNWPVSTLDGPPLHSGNYDPLVSSHQWHYDNNQFGGMNAFGAWSETLSINSEQVSPSGKGQVIAVLDTGSSTHPELNTNFVGGYDFVDLDSDPTDTDSVPPEGENYKSWHGVHVAGTIAGEKDGNGVMGIAYDAKVVPVRVLNDVDPDRGALGVLEGLLWAVGYNVVSDNGHVVPTNPNPAKIVNMSLDIGISCQDSEVGEALQGIFRAVHQKGAVIIAAAGNSNTNTHLAPADCPHVMTVAASDRGLDRAYYSNFGPSVDLVAPGGETIETITDGVISTWGTNSHAGFQGTSMAAPHVAGTAALMRELSPSMSAKAIMDIMQSTTSLAVNDCANCDHNGLLDAGAAVAALDNACFDNGFTGNEEEILRSYLAYLGRAPDYPGFAYWVGQVPSIGIDGVVSAITNSIEFENLYGFKFESIDESDFPTFVNQTFRNLFGRDADAAGLDYWVGNLENEVNTIHTAGRAIVAGAWDKEGISTDRTVIDNKLSVAKHYLTRASVTGANDSDPSEVQRLGGLFTPLNNGKTSTWLSQCVAAWNEAAN